MKPFISNGRAASAPPPAPRYPDAALALQCFHLGQLLEAGVALVDALDEVAELERHASRRALWRDIRAAIDRGASLSAAFADRPRSFDPAVRALCRAGEADGTLAATLGEIESLLHARAERRRRLRAAVAYPAFAAAVLAAATLFLFGQVVPSLAGFVRASEGGLPAHTRLLLDVAAFVGAHGANLAIAFAACACLLARASRRTGRFGRRFDRAALAYLPFARLRARFEIAGYARTVARLYRHGIELVDALELAEAGCTRPAVRAELARARSGLVCGAGYACGLLGARHLPRTLHRFAAAGESAGALGPALERAGVHLERDAARELARIEGLAGPVLLCLVGAVLLWIVVSIVLPVYDAAIGAGAFA